MPPDKYRRLKDLSELVRYNVDFEYAVEDREAAIAWLKKIGAIVEPKLRKAWYQWKNLRLISKGNWLRRCVSFAMEYSALFLQ